MFKILEQYFSLNIVLETFLETIIISLLASFIILRIAGVINLRIDAINYKRKLAMEKVKSEYAFRKAIEDSIISGIAAIDLEGNQIYANPFFSKMIGWSKDELMKMKPPFPYWPPEEISHITEVFQSAIKGRAPGKGFELVFMKKNGKRFNVQLLVSPLKDSKGMIKGWVASIRDITAQKKNEEKIMHLAFYDTLTDIPNRIYFDIILNKSLYEDINKNKRKAVFFLDLDNFKNIKNTLGYDFADKLLIKVTKELNKIIPENENVGKIGDDEYLLFSDIENNQEAVKIAQRILKPFKEPLLIEGQQINIFANIGISIFPDDSYDIDVLEKNADTAMSSSKKEGPYNYMFFDKSMTTSRQEAYKRLILSSKLSSAIKNKEFIVYYQPIVNIKNNEIICSEALVRWQKPDGTISMPNEFISLAEKTGQIISISDFVLEKALKQNKIWRQKGYSKLKTSINLSTKQFVQKYFIEKINSLQKEQNGQNIIIEITESVILQNPELSIQIIYRLKEMGYSISIDDFGTGYASLNYLKKIPADYLKIDKSFIDNITSSKKDQAIVSAAIEIAHGLGLTVTAEGVETRQQLDFLKQLNCDTFQGFIFSKAVPVEKLEKLLTENKRRKIA